MTLQQQADQILARAETERFERMRAAHREMYDLLQRYAMACREQGIRLGGITGDAEAVIAEIDGDTK